MNNKASDGKVNEVSSLAARLLITIAFQEFIGKKIDVVYACVINYALLSISLTFCYSSIQLILILLRQIAEKTPGCYVEIMINEEDEG